MSKFCNQCGAMLNDDVRFCANCGAPQPAPQPQPTYSAPVEPQPQYTAPQQQYIQPQPTASQQPPKTQNKKTGLIIGIIAAIVLIGVILGIVFGTGIIGNKDGKEKQQAQNSPESVAQAFADAVLSGRAKEAVEFLPSFLWNDDQSTKQTYIDSLTNLYEEVQEDDECDYYVSVISSREITSDEKSYLNSYLQEEFYYYYYTLLDMNDITDYKVLKMQLTLEQDGYQDSQTGEWCMIKYKGEWKVMLPFGLDY